MKKEFENTKADTGVFAIVYLSGKGLLSSVPLRHFLRPSVSELFKSFSNVFSWHRICLHNSNLQSVQLLLKLVLLLKLPVKWSILKFGQLELSYFWWAVCPIPSISCPLLNKLLRRELVSFFQENRPKKNVFSDAGLWLSWICSSF